MGNIEFIISTFINIFSNPSFLGLLFIGTFYGLVFGAIPGLTTTMAVTLLIPMTFTLDPTLAIGMMIGSYVGGVAGGAIPAILLNIPGTPDAVVTTLDGYPMCKQGKAAKAIGWGATASGIGTFFSWIVLVLFAPWFAKICISFGSPEYAALAFFGLSIIIAVSGKSIIKGLIVGLFGIILSFPGIDPIYGTSRFTFGNVNLMGGIYLMPCLIGFYAIPQILDGCTQQGIQETVKIDLKDFFPSFKEIWEEKTTILYSSIIGTIIGAIPATGGAIASYIAYDQTKKMSKDPDSFGHGNPKGVIAAETANNGVCGGALIPLLTLGIPGDSVTAMLLGGLIVHGLQPGPRLFSDRPDIIIGIFTALLCAAIMMVLIQMFAIRFFIRILTIPVNFLSAGLIILCLVGSFALRNNFFDVITALVLGVIGFLLSKGDFPMAPAILGVVLGHMFESEVRRSLRLSNGSFSIFFKPVPGTIIALAIISLIIPIITNKKRRKV